MIIVREIEADKITNVYFEEEFLEVLRKTRFGDIEINDILITYFKDYRISMCDDYRYGKMLKIKDSSDLVTAIMYVKDIVIFKIYDLEKSDFRSFIFEEEL